MSALGPRLWPIVEELPTAGRVFFAAHLRMPRPDDPLLSGWHAVNCLREWRGRPALGARRRRRSRRRRGLVLHNAWLGYERDWLPRSRGTAPAALDRAWAPLEERGLVQDGEVTAEGIALRQRIEDDTDRLSTLPWELLGEERRAAIRARLRASVRSAVAARRHHRGPELPTRVADAIRPRRDYGSPESATEGSNMSDNLRLLGKYSAAMESGDSEAVFEFFAPTFTVTSPNASARDASATTSAATSRSGGNRRAPRSPT